MGTPPPLFCSLKIQLGELVILKNKTISDFPFLVKKSSRPNNQRERKGDCLRDNTGQLEDTKVYSMESMTEALP